MAMAMTTTRGLAYSVSRVIEVSAWQSVNAVCFVACMTHGSCHWTVRSLLATAMEATSSTCQKRWLECFHLPCHIISTWLTVCAGPACVQHALARPGSQFLCCTLVYFLCDILWPEVQSQSLCMQLVHILHVHSHGDSTKPGLWTGPWTGVWTRPWTGVWTGPWTGLWTGPWIGL